MLPYPFTWRARPVVLVLALLTWLAASRTCVAQSGVTSPPAATVATGHSVRLDGVELFRVHGALGPFTAKERAERTEQRLLEFANDPFFSEALFDISIANGKGEVRYGQELISVVTEADARSEFTTIEECAAHRLARVLEAIHQYRALRLPAERWRTLGFVAGTTLVLALLLVFVTRLHRKIARRFTAPEDPAPSNVERVRRNLQRRGISIARWFIVIVLVIGYLEAVSALIPLTRAYSIAVLGYALHPLEQLSLGLLAHVGDLFFILIVFLLSRWLIQLLRFLATEAQRGTIRLPGIEPDHSLRLFNLARILVIATAIVTVFPFVPGSDSPAFRGLSLLLGAVLTFGSSGVAANFTGGLMLMFSRRFRAGDRIRVGEIEGDVVDIDLPVTHLRTTKNEVVTIPNGTFLSSQVVNFSARAETDGLVLHTTVTIGYDTPWRQVHELLLSAARRTDGILAEPAPFVHQTGLSDFYVSYELNAATREPRRMKTIYSELHQNIQDAFNSAGVQIMSPHYEADPQKPKLAPVP